jgi:hypothetical protein
MPKRKTPGLQPVTQATRDRMSQARQVQTKTVTVTVSLYPGDVELLEWLAEFLGASRSDAVRTAVRTSAVHFQEISKQIKGR